MTGLEATLLGAAAKETFGPVKAFVSKFGFSKYERLVVEYSRCFDEHVAAAYEQCSMIKNILYRDQRVELRSQYTHVQFDHAQSKVNDSNVVNFLDSHAKIIVSGTAGAGKTMFVKWLTLEAIDRMANHQRIPLYVELRYLTKAEDANAFDAFLLSSTSKADKRVSLDRFRVGLNLGQFIIILDAIDEVDKDLRDTVAVQIQQLARNYPNCIVILTTRPDDSVEALLDFRTYRTRPMTKSQVIEVIDKLHYDEVVKSKLMVELEEGLFEKHDEFLSNPLLATIMLLTYDQSANIPTKLTAFYKQAFETLYQRHDAAKGAFRRGHHAGLPLDEYERIFSVFCYDTYVDSRSQFSDSELAEYFTAAKEHYNSPVSTDDLVLDAKKSICVIQRDGLFNTFVHRSFQEYFTALFLSKYTLDDFADLIDGIVMFGPSEHVLKMLLELAPELTEGKWVEPKVRAVVRAIKAQDATTLAGCKAIFESIYSSLDVMADDGQIIGFGTSFGSNEGQSGSWLGKLGRSYTPRKKLSSAVFDLGRAGKLFSSLETYCGSIDMSSDKAEQIMQRVELLPSGDDEDDDVAEARISIRSDDLEWLMTSGLPDMLGHIRDGIVAFYDEVSERLEHQKNSMKQRSRRKGVFVAPD